MRIVNGLLKPVAQEVGKAAALATTITGLNAGSANPAAVREVDLNQNQTKQTEVTNLGQLNNELARDLDERLGNGEPLNNGIINENCVKVFVPERLSTEVRDILVNAKSVGDAEKKIKKMARANNKPVKEEGKKTDSKGNESKARGVSIWGGEIVLGKPGNDWKGDHNLLSKITVSLIRSGQDDYESGRVEYSACYENGKMVQNFDPLKPNIGLTLESN